MAEYKLELKGICKSFPGVKALDNVQLSVRPGTVHALMGENGAGKSTLMICLFGIYKMDAGEIYLDGENITAYDIDHRANAGIGYAFQQPPRFKGMTVTRMLSLAAGRELSEAESCRLLSAVGLCSDDYLNRQLDGTLSGGEMKRLEIATVLAKPHKVSIFDEPEAGIDLWSFSMLIRRFEEIHREKKECLILISHQERIINMADKIMVMYAGRPVEFGTAEEIFYESRHPYTWGLIRSIPEQAIEEKKPLTPIHGNPPSLMNLPEGCVFSPRCPYATDKCRKQRPERVVTESGHYSACHYSGDPEFLKNAPETSRTRKDSKKGGEA